VVVYYESCSSARNEGTPVATDGSIHVFQKSPWKPFVEKRCMKNRVRRDCDESGRRVLEPPAPAGTAELVPEGCSSSG